MVPEKVELICHTLCTDDTNINKNELHVVDDDSKTTLKHIYIVEDHSLHARRPPRRNVPRMAVLRPRLGHARRRRLLRRRRHPLPGSCRPRVSIRRFAPIRAPRDAGQVRAHHCP